MNRSGFCRTWFSGVMGRRIKRAAISKTARVHIRGCDREKWKVIREIAFENRVENQSQLLMSLLTFSLFLKVRFRGIPRKSGLEGFSGQT